MCRSLPSLTTCYLLLLLATYYLLLTTYYLPGRVKVPSKPVEAEADDRHQRAAEERAARGQDAAHLGRLVVEKVEAQLACTTWGCSLCYMGLQPVSRGVAACIARVTACVT